MIDVSVITTLPRPETVILQKGDNGILECPFISSPSPVLNYYLKDSTLTTINSRYKTFPNGTLMIVNVTESDEGSYNCTLPFYTIKENNTGIPWYYSTKVVIYGKYIYFCVQFFNQS